MEPTFVKSAIDASYKPGYGTEYSENYDWATYLLSRDLNSDLMCKPFCVKKPPDCQTHGYGRVPDPNLCPLRPKHHTPYCPPSMEMFRDPAQFSSDQYPCVRRETIVNKDDRGKYIDPYKDFLDKPDGRRLIGDATHPEMIFASQPSAELADPPGPYSFPTTTGLEPCIPWNKDLQWNIESESGQWPTELWRNWTHIAVAPCYDGHDDQCKYSQYKICIP